MSLHALKESDLRLAIKDSTLVKLCQEQVIETKAIQRFNEVLTALQNELAD